MIGTKKLSEIRRELVQSLGDDPKGRLDRMIADAKREGRRSELAEDLKRFLERSAPTAEKEVGKRKRKTEGDAVVAELEQFIQRSQKSLARKKRTTKKPTATARSPRHQGSPGKKSTRRPCGD
jgi:hypothetical protein